MFSDGDLMLRFFLFIFISTAALSCSPEHRQGVLQGVSDINGKGGDDNTITATGMPFSEVVERVLQPAGCFDCHGKYRKHETIIKTVIPGNPEGSRLFIRASTDMPPIEEGYLPLSEDQLSILRDWISEGANP